MKMNKNNIVVEMTKEEFGALGKSIAANLIENGIACDVLGGCLENGHLFIQINMRVSCQDE